MIVLGNAGHAHEVRALAELLGWDVSCMYGKGRDRKQRPGMPAAVGIGTPQIKSRVVDYYSSAIFPVLIHYHASCNGTIGQGCIVSAGSVIAPLVKSGDFCLFNYCCTVGHETNIGRCVTISPGANIGGRVTIEDEVFVGSGAQVLPGITLGQGCVVGAGAVVTKDVEAGWTVIGNPARAISHA